MVDSGIKKYDYIDSLRGLAILSVLLVHCGQIGTNSYPEVIRLFISKGMLGVQLFYIVSAFTLFMSMDSRRIQERHVVLNFFIRRFFRIAPLFYIAVGYYLWQNGFGARFWLGDAPGLSSNNIIATFTFTNGFNPYWINSIIGVEWSVAIEMNFYLLMPILYKTVKNLKGALALTAVMLIFSRFIRQILAKNVLITDNYLWNSYLDMFFPHQLPIFLLGIVLFYLIRNHEKTNRGGECGLSANVYLVFSLGLVIFLILNKNISRLFFYGVAFMMLGYSLYLRPTKCLVNKFTIYIGKISFSLYLVHLAVTHFMTRYHIVDFVRYPILNFSIRYALLLLLSTAISTVTYHLIENPGQNAGKKIIQFIEERSQSCRKPQEE